MQNINTERLFIVGMWWRIGYGAIRIIVGLSLLKVVGTPIIDIFSPLMGHEVSEDPTDVLYTFVTHVLALHPLSVSYFLATYFIFWGIIDVVLSYNLIRHRLWAFPASFVLIGLFICYELVRFGHTHSLILFGVICIDMCILWLIWREYNRINTSRT